MQYLNYFDVSWNKRFRHLGELVRYADDFVILCKRKAQAEEALKSVRWIMDKLELTLHESQHQRGVYKSEQTTVEHGRNGETAQS
jgi:retron-type reverse transcriptase